MINKSHAIIFNSKRYKESSLLVHAYSSKEGRLSFIVSGIGNKKSRLKGAIFQPLNILEVTFYKSKKSTLHRIKEASVIAPLYSIKSSIIKTTICQFVAEILYLTIKEEEENEQLFDFLVNSILLLENTESGVGNYHLSFLVNLTQYLGFFPKKNYSERCRYFSLSEGQFQESIEDQSVDERASILINEVISTPMHKFTLLTISREERSFLLKVFIDYYSYHIVNFDRLNSYEILLAVFK